MGDGFYSHVVLILTFGFSIKSWFQDNNEDNNFAEKKGLQAFRSVEIQTAPVADGILPGVIRQVITQ